MGDWLLTCNRIIRIECSSRDKERLTTDRIGWKQKVEKYSIVSMTGDGQRWNVKVDCGMRKLLGRA